MAGCGAPPGRCRARGRMAEMTNLGGTRLLLVINWLPLMVMALFITHILQSLLMMNMINYTLYEAHINNQIIMIKLIKQLNIFYGVSDALLFITTLYP